MTPIATITSQARLAQHHRSKAPKFIGMETSEQ